MIGGHPRLGFAVIGGVLVALAAVGGLVATAGGGARSADTLTYEAATAPGTLAGPAAADGNTTSRGGTRSPVTTPVVDPAWAARVGSAVGVPATAMAAYGGAELRMSRTQPGCHLSWNTLAGIGWVESHHGTIGDRVLEADGTSTPAVIGPALDGQGFAAIRSTPESTSWHGDPTWEHAVGPLQFIASTWEKWGSDGDSDGVADPMDLDDAAWTAARYLCADAHDLSTVDGWNAAVHSYNHDNTYVANVAAAANTYAERAAG
ncbi:lytic murein transglycosylase [Methylocystis sp.]|uniref:lytic murein transglycosylase n=1 Tax=Methylocystis sp. TaxID=1911079 RepID=UPI003DA63A86